MAPVSDFVAAAARFDAATGFGTFGGLLPEALAVAAADGLPAATGFSGAAGLASVEVARGRADNEATCGPAGGRRRGGAVRAIWTPGDAFCQK